VKEKIYKRKREDVWDKALERKMLEGKMECPTMTK
jgi:hypothetical protein